MSQWEPRAVIVMIIAIAVSVTAIGSVIAVGVRGSTISEVGGDVFIAILGAMIAIIAGYVARERRDDDQPPDKEPPP